MDEFESPAARRESGFSPVLAAIFFGAVFGGGLSLQGRSLQALAGQLRGVIDSPALGGSAAEAAQWTPREDEAQRQLELERQLTAPWPAERMLVASQPPAAARRPAVAAPIDYGLAARGAVLAAAGHSVGNFMAAAGR